MAIIAAFTPLWARPVPAEDSSAFAVMEVPPDGLVRAKPEAAPREKYSTHNVYKEYEAAEDPSRTSFKPETTP
jgi:hypothetical protein